MASFHHFQFVFTAVDDEQTLLSTIFNSAHRIRLKWSYAISFELKHSTIVSLLFQRFQLPWKSSLSTYSSTKSSPAASRVNTEQQKRVSDDGKRALAFVWKMLNNFCVESEKIESDFRLVDEQKVMIISRCRCQAQKHARALSAVSTIFTVHFSFVSCTQSIFNLMFYFGFSIRRETRFQALRVI